MSARLCPNVCAKNRAIPFAWLWAPFSYSGHGERSDLCAHRPCSPLPSSISSFTATLEGGYQKRSWLHCRMKLHTGPGTASIIPTATQQRLYEHRGSCFTSQRRLTSSACLPNAFSRWRWSLMTGEKKNLSFVVYTLHLLRRGVCLNFVSTSFFLEPLNIDCMTKQFADSRFTKSLSSSTDTASTPTALSCSLVSGWSSPLYRMHFRKI